MKKEFLSKEWIEKKAAIEGDFDICAGKYLFHFKTNEKSEETTPFIPDALMKRRCAFAVLIRSMRIAKNKSIEKFAQDLDVDNDHIERIEQDISFSPPIRTGESLTKHQLTLII